MVVTFLRTALLLHRHPALWQVRLSFHQVSQPACRVHYTRSSGLARAISQVRALSSFSGNQFASPPSPISFSQFLFV